MKILARLILVFVGIVVATLGALYVGNRHHVEAFTHLPSAYYAKEFCTCSFVIGQDEAFCHDYASIAFPKQLADPEGGWSWDPAAKTVTVSAMGEMTVAKYVGGRQGCVIADPYLP